MKRQLLSGLARALLALMVLTLPAVAIAAPAPARAPLKLDAGQPDATALYQRVLTLDGAELLKAPDAGAPKLRATLPVFSILYVFDRKAAGGANWLEVGQGIQGQGTGWVREDLTQRWDIMLTMEYAPPGQRQPVLFFDQREDLAKLVHNPSGPGMAKELLLRLDPAAPAAAAADRGGVTVVEERPETGGAVSSDRKPYVMPILAFKSDEFDSGTATTLVQIASIPARPAAATPGGGVTPAAPAPPPVGEAVSGDNRIGIAFVIDTTKSMGPYIERTRASIHRIYDTMKQKKLLGRVTFAFVGYRNSTERTPGLEYTAKIFQPFNLQDPPEKVLKALDAVHDTNVSSHSWDEDAVAGLNMAVTGLDWSPFKTRLLFLVTDAGTLESADPAASLHNVGLTNIHEMAEREHISIFPIHLLSAASERAGITPHARDQWQGLSRTGDVGVSKYVAVPAASPERFEQELKAAEGKITGAILDIAKGTAVQRPALPDHPAPEQPTLGDLVVNEIFSAQARYVGELKGTAAPRIVKAWASDRDLADPRRPALRVHVFLTKTQLNDLAQKLSGIVEKAKASQMSADSFFNQLRALAAATSADPNRHGAQFTTITDSGLLPSYLKLLPYRSDVLSMTEQRYRDMGLTEQQRFISSLESKLLAYADIDANAARWLPTNAGEAGDKVVPLPLGLLP